MTTTQVQGLSVATEAIDFQDGSFFNELVNALNAFPRAERSDQKSAGWATLEAQMEKIILKNIGVKVNFTFSADGEQSIVASVPDWTHVFSISQVGTVSNPEATHRFYAKIGKEMKSCVDLKKSFISGSLAKELSINIDIHRAMLYGKAFGYEFTDEEIVAIILHELGHFFTQMELLDRSVSTNQVLAELSRNLFNEKEPSKRETIIKAAGKELHMDRSVVQSISNSDDSTVTTVFLTTGMKNIRTQSGHSFYDMNTWEMLADQFAARHGAGKHLFSGLHKLLQWMPDMSMESRASFYYNQIASVVSGMILLGAGGAFLVSGSILIGLVGILLGITGVLNTHESWNEPTYDNDYSRLKRIRNQHMQAVKLALGRKKTQFTTTFVSSLNADIAMMDKVLESGRDQPTAMAKLYAFFSANEANRQANTAFQKELEGLAHNDLYAKALALKTI